MGTGGMAYGRSPTLMAAGPAPSAAKERASPPCSPRRRRRGCGSGAAPPGAAAGTTAPGPAGAGGGVDVSAERVMVSVVDRHLWLSNRGKVLYRASGFTKGELLDYYSRIAGAMLPPLMDRPVTFRRCPDGTGGKSFIEKHVPWHAPDWIRTVKVPSRSAGEGRGRSSGEEAEYAVINARPSLIWAANLAAIEFHVPLWHAGRRAQLPGRPDHLVFDLDPGPGTSIAECCRIASWIAD